MSNLSFGKFNIALADNRLDIDHLFNKHAEILSGYVYEEQSYDYISVPLFDMLM